MGQGVLVPFYSNVPLIMFQGTLECPSPAQQGPNQVSPGVFYRLDRVDGRKSLAPSRLNQ